MMKKTMMLFLGLTVAFFTDAQVQTPAASPSTTVKQTAGLTNFEVNYSRPSLRGRDLYKEIIPLDKMWRFGANKNTTISFDTDVTIQGTQVKKGTYAMFATPHEDAWEIMLYKDTENWGVPAKLEDKKIAANFKVEVTRNRIKEETFTISFDDMSNSDVAVMNISWDRYIIPVKIELPTRDIAIRSIEKTMSGKPTESDYYRAAVYYSNEDIDVKKAVEYFNEAIKMNGNAPMYYYYNKAVAEHKAGMVDDAKKTATISFEKAEKSKSEEYMKKSKELLRKLSENKNEIKGEMKKLTR